MAILRSYLFAPGNREDLVRKVFTAGADAVVLDLEDSVPASQKAFARKLIAAALRESAGNGCPAAFVRINPIASGLADADAAAAVARGLTGLRVAKAELPSEIAQLDALLGRLEAERGVPRGAVELTLAIESAAGVERATELATCSPRVRNLCFGAADFCGDVNVVPSPSDEETLFARSRLVISSKVGRLDPPIASVYTRLDDDEGLRDHSEAARRLGFFGASCVHPRQVPIVNAVFTPRPAEIERARRLKHAYDEAVGRGSAATVADNGQFIDPAVIRRAVAVLSLADRFREPPRD